MSVQARCSSHTDAEHHSDAFFLKLDKERERKNYVANQFRIFSVKYGCFICLVGVVLTSVEPFKACSYAAYKLNIIPYLKKIISISKIRSCFIFLKGTECENKLKIFIESFFIYLYSVSIVWIMVMFGLIIYAKKSHSIGIKSHTGQKRRLSLATLETPKATSRSSPATDNVRLIFLKLQIF
jgi:hypothetical protein